MRTKAVPPFLNKRLNAAIECVKFSNEKLFEPDQILIIFCEPFVTVSADCCGFYTNGQRRKMIIPFSLCIAFGAHWMRMLSGLNDELKEGERDKKGEVRGLK